MLTTRQQQLFGMVVDSFISSALPVGSKFLSEAGGLQISSATIRNEMRFLEEQGLIEQPFTSAGRVPTEKGYSYYIEHILDREKPLSKKFQDALENSFEGDSSSMRIKNLAKAIASFTRASVAVGFSHHDTYYTGISYLFENPEFSDYDFARSISSVVDRLEDSMDTFFDTLSDDIEIYVGKKNPLHPQCAALVGRVEKKMLFGIFGPMRMDYQKNYETISFIRQLIQETYDRRNTK